MSDLPQDLKYKFSLNRKQDLKLTLFRSPSALGTFRFSHILKILVSIKNCPLFEMINIVQLCCIYFYYKSKFILDSFLLRVCPTKFLRSPAANVDFSHGYIVSNVNNLVVTIDLTFVTAFVGRGIVPLQRADFECDLIVTLVAPWLTLPSHVHSPLYSIYN